MSTTILHQVVVGVITLSLALCIISTSTKYWYEEESTILGKTVTVNSGLWQICTDTPLSSSCDKLDFVSSEHSNKLKTIQAFAIMAIIAFLMALIALIIVYKSKSILLCFLFLVVPAILFQMIAMSVYTDLYKNNVKLDGAKYSWSFALGWIAFILSIFGLGGGIVVKVSGSEIE